MKLHIFSLLALSAFFIAGCSPKDERTAEQMAEEYRIADERMKKEEEHKRFLENAYASRDQFDQAVRDDAKDRRARLEKASTSIRTTNKHGVRVDQYILPDGRIIACTTTISGNSPAIFSCDGDV